MDKFVKSSLAIKELFSTLVGGTDCERKTMFGYPVAFMRGNMFCGVFGESLFFRLPEPDREEFLGRGGVIGPFEPVKGRTMREYVAVSGPSESRSLIEELFVRSLRHAATLPGKEAKKS